MDIKVNEAGFIANLPKQDGTKGAATDEDFFFTLQKIDNKELESRLHGLMADIEKMGKRLAEHMDVRDLKLYRKSVKEFLNEVISNSHKFSRENFLDRRGRHRVYGIVKKVDESLDELAQELIKKEKNQLAILDKVNEIKGLLLDITL